MLVFSLLQHRTSDRKSNAPKFLIYTQIKKKNCHNLSYSFFVNSSTTVFSEPDLQAPHTLHILNHMSVCHSVDHP